MKLSHIPTRAVTGGYILHSGLDKWKADEGTQQALHRFAGSAYPIVQALPPGPFLRLLAAGEMAVGAALLTPFVPDVVAGAMLAGFSASLLGLYARTPGMRRPGSIWPSQPGIALSKDVWMLGIGLELVVDR